MNLGDDAEDGWNGAWVDRVAPADEAAPLPQLLARPAVDAIVSCAADSARCHERVTEARRQIGLAPRIVPLIVWRLDPTGPAAPTPSCISWEPTACSTPRGFRHTF
jgi:hypothetical protein